MGLKLICQLILDMTDALSEITLLRKRKFRDYSWGHQRCYLGPLELIRRQSQHALNILDVGSGIGWGWAQLFSILGDSIKYVGIELDSETISYHREQVSQSRHHQNTTLVEGSFTKLRLPKEFDYVFCIEVLEHVPKKGVPQFISNLRFACKGILFLSTPNVEENDHGEYTPKEIESMLKKHGFKNVVTITEQWTTQYIAQ